MSHRKPIKNYPSTLPESMSRVPKLMCTQHPDSTVRITAQMETEEAIASFAVYGCDEVMVDYEGKLTPYSQPRDVVKAAAEADLPVGEGFVVTVRLPNPRLEGEERLVLALTAAALANRYAGVVLGVRAVKWLVLPMLEDPQEIFSVRTTALSIGKALEVGESQLVPLLESVESQLRIREYLSALTHLYGDGLEGQPLRVFVGKSDAAVMSGHVASALSARYALWEAARFGREKGVAVAPIAGMGSPTFRGGLNNPSLVSLEVEAYRGFMTATVQSAIRYDSQPDTYRSVAERLRLGCGSAPNPVEGEALSIAEEAKRWYTSTLRRYAGILRLYAKEVPQTRDRLLWTEYGRSLCVNGAVLSLPRAITFVAAWYSLGLPPTFLDAPYLLKLAREDRLDYLLHLLPNLREEWSYEAQFFVPRVAEKALGEELVQVVKAAMELLGVEGEACEEYARLIEQRSTGFGLVAAARWRGFLG